MELISQDSGCLFQQWRRKLKLKRVLGCKLQQPARYASDVESADVNV
jgi:hypothetical protein